jgi:hypothetical protein
LDSSVVIHIFCCDLGSGCCIPEELPVHRVFNCF